MNSSEHIYGESYFGFIYMWYDVKHERYYIGSHMGSIHDGLGMVWIRRGLEERKIPKDDPIPEGWMRGRSRIPWNKNLV